ncbi:MAG: DNA-binding response regulator [Acidimicrobiales bacterium]|nr:MAG: DNA-binding response regulator [Acidimicrobiales bacterium]
MSQAPKIVHEEGVPHCLGAEMIVEFDTSVQESESIEPDAACGAATDSETGKLRILVVEDQTLVGEAIAGALREHGDMEVCGVAGSLAEAMALLDTCTPDLALVDYKLPDANGYELVRAVKQRRPECHVVVFTAAENERVVARCIKAGADGFVTKSSHLDEMVDMVRRAAAGEALFTPKLLASVVGLIRSGDRQPGDDLSSRELEVLRLVAKSKSVPEISRELCISEHTARNHIRNILTKLGAHTKLEAVVLALKHGLLSPEQLWD